MPLIKKFIKPYTAYECEADLLQESYFGLVSAVQHYETSKNVKFSTYMKYWIVQSVQRYKTIEPKAALPLFFIQRVQSSPPDERKEGDSMVTYSDLIQTGIFIVALVGLCYTIFKGKKK